MTQNRSGNRYRAWGPTQCTPLSQAAALKQHDFPVSATTIHIRWGVDLMGTPNHSNEGLGPRKSLSLD